MADLVLSSVNLPSLQQVGKGKTRDIYKVDESQLLMVASDRISAYDFVLNNVVQDKGHILTLITNYWLTTILPEKLPNLKTHFVSLSPPPAPILTAGERQLIRGRSLLVRRYKMIPLEVIVRGYITGSAWAEYQQKGTVHGMPQPRGLQRCQAFPGGPIYTPSTKAEYGSHDENISQDKARMIVGDKYADKIEELALAIYKAAHEWALERGIIIADTKVEFGIDEETDEVILADEVITPDCSRFWPAADYEVGRDQRSFDKQYLCDWLTNQGLRGQQGVTVPEDVIRRTRQNYHEIFERLTGTSLKDARQRLKGKEAKAGL